MSSVPVLNKFVVLAMPPLEGAMINSIFAAVFFLVVSRGRFLSLRFSRYSLGAGALNTVGLGCLFLALVNMHPAVAGLVNRTGVVFAIIISATLLRQRPSRAEILLGGIAIVGAFGSAWRDLTSTSAESLCLALTSAASFAGSNFCLREAAKSESNVLVLARMNILSALLLGLVFASSSEPLQIPSDAFSWTLVLIAALLGSCLGFWFYLISLRQLSFSMAAILRSTGPFFTALIAYPFFGFDLNPIQIISALILIGAIIGLAVVSRPVPTPESLRTEAAPTAHESPAGGSRALQ